MRKKRIASMLLVIVLMMSLSVTSAFAYTAKTSERHVFSGRHTDFGTIFWGIDFDLECTYVNPSNPYRITQLRASAYITPKQSFEIGQGVLDASVIPKIDYNNQSALGIHPNRDSRWVNTNVYVGTNTHKYFDVTCAYSGTINRQASLTGYYYFSNTATYMYNSNYELVLRIYGPLNGEVIS